MCQRGLAPARAPPPPTQPPAPPARPSRRRLAVGRRPLTCSGTGLGWVVGPLRVPGLPTRRSMHAHLEKCQGQRSLGLREPGLLETTSNLLELLARESTHRLRTHAALGNRAKDQTGRGLIIGGLRNHHIIILSHDEIEPYEFPARLSCSGVESL